MQKMQNSVMMALVIAVAVSGMIVIALIIGITITSTVREHEYQLLRKEYEERMLDHSEDINKRIKELEELQRNEAYLNKRRYEILEQYIKDKYR